MVEPRSAFTDQLIGSEILCPLCENERVNVSTTKKETPMFYCRTQRTPVFVNHPRELPDRVLPDELTEDDQDADLEQESNPWEPDPDPDEDEDASSGLGRELLAEGDQP